MLWVVLLFGCPAIMWRLRRLVMSGARRLVVGPPSRCVVGALVVTAALVGGGPVDGAALLPREFHGVRVRRLVESARAHRRARRIIRGGSRLARRVRVREIRLQQQAAKLVVLRLADAVGRRRVQLAHTLHRHVNASVLHRGCGLGYRPPELVQLRPCRRALASRATIFPRLPVVVVGARVLVAVAVRRVYRPPKLVKQLRRLLKVLRLRRLVVLCWRLLKVLPRRRLVVLRRRRLLEVLRWRLLVVLPRRRLVVLRRRRLLVVLRRRLLEVLRRRLVPLQLLLEGVAELVKARPQRRALAVGARLGGVVLPKLVHVPAGDGLCGLAPLLVVVVVSRAVVACGRVGLEVPAEALVAAEVVDAARIVGRRQLLLLLHKRGAREPVDCVVRGQQQLLALVGRRVEVRVVRSAHRRRAAEPVVQSRGARVRETPCRREGESVGGQVRVSGRATGVAREERCAATEAVGPGQRQGRRRRARTKQGRAQGPLHRGAAGGGRFRPHPFVAEGVSSSLRLVSIPWPAVCACVAHR